MTEPRTPQRDDTRRSGAYLPDISTDESDLGWGELPEDSAHDDQRILREVPPHHL